MKHLRRSIRAKLTIDTRSKRIDWPCDLDPTTLPNLIRRHLLELQEVYGYSVQSYIV